MHLVLWLGIDFSTLESTTFWVPLPLRFHRCFYALTFSLLVPWFSSEVRHFSKNRNSLANFSLRHHEQRQLCWAGGRLSSLRWVYEVYGAVVNCYRADLLTQIWYKTITMHFVSYREKDLQRVNSTFISLSNGKSVSLCVQDECILAMTNGVFQHGAGPHHTYVRLKSSP